MADHDPPPRADLPEPRRPGSWRRTLVRLAALVGLLIVVQVFLVQGFTIPSASMEPLLVDHDRIAVQKVSYRTGSPRRGDVVVFSDPGGWLPESDGSGSAVRRALGRVGLFPAGGHLVKRVIGVGGDEVRCCDSRGRLSVDGRPLDETSYLPRGTVPSRVRFDVRVPAGSLWVMGDNRGDSADSRAHLGDPGGGMVGTDLVVGKVFAVFWPPGRIRIVRRPGTFAGPWDDPTTARRAAVDRPSRGTAQEARAPFHPVGATLPPGCGSSP